MQPTKQKNPAAYRWLIPSSSCHTHQLRHQRLFPPTGHGFDFCQRSSLQTASFGLCVLFGFHLGRMWRGRGILFPLRPELSHTAEPEAHSLHWGQHWQRLTPLPLCHQPIQSAVLGHSCQKWPSLVLSLSWVKFL